MFTLERRTEILNILKAKKAVSVKELSEQFFIGETTIRKDLQILEKAGQAKRTYGGAMLVEGMEAEKPFFIRQLEQKDNKQIIASIASGLVNDGDVMMMDASSTTLRMIPFLANKKNITVITNNAKIAVEASEKIHAKVYCTGGTLRGNSQSFVGEHANQYIKNFYADILFFSCRAISLEEGLTDSFEDEVNLLRIMMERSRKVVLLSDGTKLDKIHYLRISGIDKIHYLITDQKPSSRWIEFLSAHGIELLYG